jgi:hypothetical protein
MCHKLDMRFFQELEGMNPDDVCRRTLCAFDRDRACYLVEAWGERYEVYAGRGEILPVNRAMPPVSIEWGLVILFYLLRSQDTPIGGDWISEKDLPGGVTFFTGPHAIPTHLIKDRFGNEIDGFKEVCENLGGKPIDMADAAFVFRILPRVPVAVLLWRGDDEFDAEARVLFDRTISQQLPLDVIFGMTVVLCSSIARA